MLRSIKFTFLPLLILVLTTWQVNSQDQRTLDTKIADLLVQVPAQNQQELEVQMQSLLALKEAGLQLLMDRVIPPGTGDDTKARVAIESLSRYLSQTGMEMDKASWEVKLLAEIDRQENALVKSFFISQLNYTGSNATIEGLSKYITNPELQDPVIRAMRDANPELAGELFAENLKQVSGNSQIALVNAIREIGNADLAPSVKTLEGSMEIMLQKSVLACLASLGHPDSYKTLMATAKKAEFMPEPTQATASLLAYAGTMSEKGNHALSLGICQILTKKCNAPEQVHFKTGALLTAAGNDNIEKSVSILVDAMQTKYKEHRMAAINYAVEHKSPVDPWIKSLNRSRDPEIKSEILYLLGMLGDAEAVETVKGYMIDPDASIRQQAAKSMAQIGKSRAVEDLLEYTLNYPEPPDTETSRAVLLQTVGKDQVQMLADRMVVASEGAKVVLIEVIAAKENPEYFELIYRLSEKEGPVRSTAIENLYKVSASDNLPELLALFDRPMTKDEKVNLEKALVNAIISSPDKAEITHALLSHAVQNSALEEYVGVLASVGGREAMAEVYKVYSHGSESSKKEAFNGLVHSNDVSASQYLFEICSTTSSSEDKELVFNNYVRIVYESDLPDDQKLLLLRKIENLSPNLNSTGNLIWILGDLKTFLSFVTLSSYLHQDELQSQAANALVRVALPSQGHDNGLEGAMVREKLTEAIKILSGPESEYTRVDIENYLDKMSDQDGYVSMFNGTDLSGWQGLSADPVSKEKLTSGELTKLQNEANEKIKENWSVKDHCIVFNGDGSNLCSIKQYGSFEMLVDWRITKNGDSGIYLRGSPQVQIWDTSRVDVGAQVGSGGLYNNQVHKSNPLLVADNPVGEWNTFRIRMMDDRVTVYLNGQLVVDSMIMENYWDRTIPIFPEGPIELQAHGTDLAFRDLYIRNLEPAGNRISEEELAEGFVTLFNGKDLTGWTGENHSYKVEDGSIVIRPAEGGGNLYTEWEYSDFSFRFEFKLTPGANNGLGIRTPMKGDAAYVGYELQILDNTAEVYKNLEPYQYHGSVYGILPAKRGFLKPVGEWNSQEVMVKGEEIRVTLNGVVILDGNLKEATNNGTADGKEHPGLERSGGHIGFLGHGSLVWFRNIRIKEL